MPSDLRCLTIVVSQAHALLRSRLRRAAPAIDRGVDGAGSGVRAALRLAVKTNPRPGGSGTGGSFGGGSLEGELLLFEFGVTAASLELLEELEIAAPVIVGGLLAAEETLEG